MISIEGLKVEFGVKPLFSDVNFVINEHDRIALVGKNGAGKSTMLKIIYGLQKPTAGTISFPKDCTIGYLPQVMKLQDDTSVKEETRKAFADHTRMKDELMKMQQEMADRTDYESEGYSDLVERFTQEQERYMMMGGENYEADIERVLIGLGFERCDFDRPTKELSGGWRMRIELAKILLRKPDVLLLDEPTNHLDMPSKDVLKEAIKAFDGTAVIVSHDREFLDGLVSKVYEFGGGEVKEHLGGIYDWLRVKNAECGADGEYAQHAIDEVLNAPADRDETVQQPLAKDPEQDGGQNSNKQSYAEHKEQQKKVRKAERAVKDSEEKITSMEKRIKELDALLMKAENASNMKLVTEYTSTKEALDQENDKWMILSQKLEEIQE